MVASSTTGRSGPAKGAKYNKRPPMLTDMRWAYRHLEDGKVGTAAQEQFRRMYFEKPTEFIAMMDRLERQDKPVKKAGPTGNPRGPKPAPPEVGNAPPPADAGEAKCVELVERLLGEGGWRDAARP